MEGRRPAGRTDTVVLDGRSLTLDAFLHVVRGGAAVELAPEAIERARASRGAVERAVSAGRAVYGVTTGFGALSAVTIPGDRVRDLQVSLIRSHASGTGPVSYTHLTLPTTPYV